MSCAIGRERQNFFSYIICINLQGVEDLRRWIVNVYIALSCHSNATAAVRLLMIFLTYCD